MRRTVSPFLFLSVWAVGLAAPVAAQDAAAEGRPVCFISGRTAQCTFTFVFDAAIERFTEVRARPQGTDSITDRASMPIDRFTLPVLTGDGVIVEVRNLPYGERVEAGAATVAATPFPRPALDETLSLSAITLKSFETVRMPAPHIGSANLSDAAFVPGMNFALDSMVFRQRWNTIIRPPLAAYSDDFLKRVQGITPEARRKLAASALALKEAGPVLTSNLEALSATLAASARTLQSECVDAAAATAEQLCLPRLYEASATAQRQAGLARSLRALAAALGLEAAAALADSAGRILETPAAKALLDVDLSRAALLAAIPVPAAPPASGPTPAWAQSVAAQVRGSPLGTELQNVLTAANPATMAQLRANLAYAAADLATLQKYQRLRDHLLQLENEVRDNIDSIRVASERLDEHRVRLALESNRLVFAFDAAAARASQPFRLPVFRTTADEEVTVTLTRTARFAPLPPTQFTATATSSTETKTEPAPARTYTEKLLARKRHYFQIIAGFVFSDIRSSRFGVVDRKERGDTDGDGTDEEVTVRRISRTADRARLFVPAAQLVFHPWGKDVHPDAYRTRNALRPGISIGTTLDAPVTNFSAGLVLEPIPGLHLSGGRLWSQVEALQQGWAVDDELPAETQAAPTSDRFANGWYAGAMLDLSVFAGFFGQLLGGK